MLKGGGGGGGKITTTHKHYTDFEIDGVAFRCDGDLTFKDGDKVRLYGFKTDKGYYYVVLLQNFTRDFYVGKKPRKPVEGGKESSKKTNNVIVTILKTLMTTVMTSVIMGFYGAMIGIPVGVIVALIAWGFFDAPFWKTLEIAWLITIIACIVVFLIECIIPKSESAKQKEKQLEEEEQNRRKEAWAMYQKVINDDE